MTLPRTYLQRPGHIFANAVFLTSLSAFWRFHCSGTARIMLEFDIFLKCVRRHFKGCGMGPWLVLVSPLFWGKCSCHMQNWVFLCNLDNLLRKHVIVVVVFFLFFFLKSHFKMKKRPFLTYFSHFLVTRESYKNSF